MSSGQQIPPWLQEQLAKLQQAQQNLQAILAQKQQLELDQHESNKALEELKKAGDTESVYKFVGSIMIKSTKKTLVDEIEERNELSKTRATVLAKQEERVKQSITEQETKINDMIKNATTGVTPPKTNLPK